MNYPTRVPYKRQAMVIAVVFSMFALTLSSGTASPTSIGAAQIQPGCETITQTGKAVCGQFLAYWKALGDIALHGFPISNEFIETSETDGKIYTVQYFERAVFEKHPENQPPYDMLLSLLGTMTYKQKYSNGAQELPASAMPGVSMVFPETGKEVRGVFLQYWKSHGGVAQYGLPITNLVSEKSELDGKEYIMQYFERAVFELHPENKAPYDVLLSQLGTLQFQKKYPNGPTLPASEWGGENIYLFIENERRFLRYHCDTGLIDDASIVLDENGYFDVQGDYVFDELSSERPIGPYNQHLTRYTGTVKGDIMTLTITVSNATRANPNVPGHKVLGTFTLTLNQPAIFIHGCPP